MARRVTVHCPECGSLNQMLEPIRDGEIIRHLVCPVCECVHWVDLVDPAKDISNERPGSR